MLYFIDFENVGSAGLTGIDKVNDDDEVIIFFNQNSTITMSVHKKLEAAKCKKQYYQVNCKTKNALDFQLATYLGSLTNDCTEFYIISKDTGFDAVIQFWKQRNVKITRANNVAKEIPIDLKEKLTEIFSENEKYNVSEIKQIIDSYKTKQSINSALCKKYGNTEASIIYKSIKPLLTDKK